MISTAHCGDRMTPSLKLILSVSFPLQYWTIDRIELQVILRSSKVEETEPVHVSLVLRRERYLLINCVVIPNEASAYPVYGGLDVVPGQK